MSRDLFYERTKRLWKINLFETEGSADQPRWER